MKKILFIVLILFYSVGDSYGQTGKWTRIFPDGEDFYSIIKIGKDSILLGADYGRIYLSTDDGNRWVQIGIPGANSDNIFVKSLEYVEHNIIAGTYSGPVHNEKVGIFRSTNNGKLWERYLDGVDIYSLAYNDNFILTGTRNGLFLSTDNGKIWVYKDIGFKTYTDPVSIIDNHFVVATHLGILFSTDYGNNWVPSNIYGGSWDIIPFLVVGDDIYTSIYDDDMGIYVSKDKGENWNLVGSTQTYVGSLSINQGTIFAGGPGGIVYFSKDNGGSWYKSTVDTNWISDIITRLLVDGNDIFALFSGGRAYRAKISDLITDVKDEQMQANDISIYPNPAGDYIYLNSLLIEGVGGVLEYTILDLLGQNVQRSILTDSKIDISQLPTGVYCIVFSNSGKQIIKKFIKY